MPQPLPIPECIPLLLEASGRAPPTPGAYSADAGPEAQGAGDLPTSHPAATG